MVAFQGQVRFDHEKSGSVGKMLKKAFTAEDVPLMRVSGQAEVFFANGAATSTASRQHRRGVPVLLPRPGVRRRPALRVGAINQGQNTGGAGLMGNLLNG